jgi:carboxyl-terminal processing protease
MEEVHLEHRDISLLDSRAILLNFLGELDHWKMVFLQKDVDVILEKFTQTLDIYVGAGSLTPAFEIFNSFRVAAFKFANKAIRRLEFPFDFSKNETFSPDRKDCNWPLTEEEADILWEKRLKFEVLGEAINLCKSKKKESGCCKNSAESEGNCTECAQGNHCRACSISKILICEDDVMAVLPEAVNNVRRRHESWRRTFKDIDPWVVQEMFLNSISNMYDPHTSFLSRDSFEDFNVRIRNSLIGVGAELADENGVCTIQKLTPGGPAQLSGEIKSGDKIIAVAQGDDGEFVDIVGLRLYKTVKLLRGQKDTVVRVKLETAAGDTKEVRLVRDNIKMNEARASAKYFELERGKYKVKIGVIELPSFYGDCDNEQSISASGDVKKLLEILKGRGIDGLVIDLRQNGGGLLDQAISIAGLFIETGPVVQVKDSRGIIEQFYDDDARVDWDGPLAILSSSMSASASEILIGALRDHKRALIVGAESTYGKGSVQAAIDMNRHFRSFKDGKNLGAVYITVQKWYLPTGSSTQLKGVPSDIKLVGLDECFHRREADHAHALEWDTIPPADFGDAKPSANKNLFLDDDLISKLSKLSNARQETMEEFAVLMERVDRFDEIVNRKEIPLKISTRLTEKIVDDAVKNEISEKISILSKTQGYNYEGINLPDIKSVEASTENDENKKHDDVDGIEIFDTNLRESLRIVVDWVEITQPSKFGSEVLLTAIPNSDSLNSEQ